MDEGDGAGPGLGASEASAFDEKGGEGPGNDLQDGGEQMGLGGEEMAQGNGEREHPLAHGHVRDDVVEEMGGGELLTCNHIDHMVKSAFVAIYA